jgi:AhpD family alkylhydroperoxidase
MATAATSSELTDHTGLTDHTEFTDHTGFSDHTVDSAPAGSRRLMEQTTARLGYLPTAIGRMAESPELLSGFLTATGLFERTSLDPLAREVLIMTIAARNECHVCVAMHTAKLTQLAASPDLIDALRAGHLVADERLAGLQAFTLAVLASRGAVSPADLQQFLAAGYTRQNALEVVLGIGASTISTFANRLTGAGVDEPLTPFAWTPSKG